MSQQFHAEPDRIQAVGRAFASQQRFPDRLATRIDGARGADVGQPALNGEIQVLVGELLAGLTGLSAGLMQDSAGLTARAQCYRDADSAGAACANPAITRLDQLGLGR